jgi:hypothetical protein
MLSGLHRMAVSDVRVMRRFLMIAGLERRAMVVIDEAIATPG